MKQLVLLPLAAILLVTSCSEKPEEKPSIEKEAFINEEIHKKELKFSNEQFYDAEGNFLEDAA